MDFLVYALVDPRDRLPHYVGRTNDLAARMRGHLAPGRGVTGRARIAWLDDLAAVDLKPDAQVLEAGLSFASAVKAEQRWVERGSAEGWPLTNRRKTRGGALPASERRKRINRAFDALSHKEKLAACRGARPGSVAAEWMAHQRQRGMTKSA